MKKPEKPCLVGAILLATGAALAQEPPKQGGFTEKVEVRVRTVLASITDAKGRPVTKTPSPSELTIKENGQVVEIIAVEPVRRPAAPPAQPAGEPGVPAAAPAPAVAIPQYLYLDTTTLLMRSVRAIAAAFTANLDEIVRSGPLAIVVADPEPQTFAASTSDPAALREALAALAKKIPGKQRVVTVRQDYQQDQREGTVNMRNGRRQAWMSIKEEVQLLQSSLGRLQRWATDLPDDRPGILYLGNDGFDADPTETYRNELLSSGPEGSNTAQQLLSEYGGAVTKLLDGTEKALAARGLRTVPLALGGMHAEFANSAGNTGALPWMSLHSDSGSVPVSYFARPMEPLGLLAGATGGEVVTTETRFATAVGNVGGLYLVTFRTSSPTDGTVHALEVASTTGDLKVAAPRYLAAGTLTSAAAGKATHALSAARPENEGIEVTVAIEAIGRSGKKMQGELSVTADLTGIAPVLEKLGQGRVRVTVAVELPGSEPFVSHEEADLDHSGAGTIWLYEAKINWPTSATRVAVTVEELKTGARGTGVAELPKIE